MSYLRSWDEVNIYDAAFPKYKNFHQIMKNLFAINITMFLQSTLNYFAVTSL